MDQWSFRMWKSRSEVACGLQDALSGSSERLSPGKGRALRPGVLVDAANWDGGTSPTRATPRLGKRKMAEVDAASACLLHTQDAVYDVQQLHAYVRTGSSLPGDRYAI